MKVTLYDPVTDAALDVTVLATSQYVIVGALLDEHCVTTKAHVLIKLHDGQLVARILEHHGAKKPLLQTEVILAEV